MRAASANPISLTEPAVSDLRFTVTWTRRGLVLAGLGCALFVAGMWRVDGVMAALGLAIGGVFAMAWLLGRLNLRGLVLGYRGPRRVEVGKGFTGHLAITNGRRVLDGFRIGFGVSLPGGKVISGKVHWLESRGRADIAQRISFAARGYYQSHKGWVESGFPLGLMRFRKEQAVSAEIGILAAIKVPREMTLSGFLLDGPPLGGSRYLGGIGEWKGLREWRGGDSVRRIAWVASMRSEAAGGGLLVREDEPPGSQAEGCLVVFHSYGGDGNLIRPDRFEKAISLMSGTLGALQGWGMPVRWVSDFNGWREMEVKSRRQLALSRECLMLANRAAWTEAHDLRSALATVRDGECVVVISDMPIAAWVVMMPKTLLPPVTIEISNYDGSSRLRKGGGK